MMTRLDYRLIAMALSSVKSGQNFPSKFACWLNCQKRIADMMESRYDNFNREKFDGACGVEE